MPKLVQCTKCGVYGIPGMYMEHHELRCGTNLPFGGTTYRIKLNLKELQEQDTK